MRIIGKRFISVFVSIVLVVGLCPSLVYAQENAQDSSLRIGIMDTGSEGEAEPSTGIDISAFSIVNYEERVSIHDTRPFWYYGITITDGSHTVVDSDLSVLFIDSNSRETESVPTVAGSYTMKIVPANADLGYTGTLTKPIELVDAAVMRNVYVNVDDERYGVGAVPDLAVYVYDDDDERDDLVEGTDYAAALQRLNASTDAWASVSRADQAGEYRYVITGKGAYAGTKYAEFQVVAANSLKLARVSMPDQPASQEVSHPLPLVNMPDGDGGYRPLVNETDFTVTYEVYDEERESRTAVPGVTAKGE